MRTSWITAASLIVPAALVPVVACSSDSDNKAQCAESDPSRCSGPNGNYVANGLKDNTETDIDCGGPSAPKCDDGRACVSDSDCRSGVCPADSKICHEAGSNDTVQNGLETDVDCGGPDAPKCGDGKKCLVDTDCAGACNYAKKCVDAPSCKAHLGGDTCGAGEVGQPNVQHENCCRTLPVEGYTDPAHPGKTVYLDKYEITAGRVRAFIADIAARYGGTPNIRDWLITHPPAIWDNAWNKFMPQDWEGGIIRIDRRLLGDRRGGPDEPPIPETDQDRRVGVNYQFNGQDLVYLHGNNCSTHAPDAFGFPTFFYPPEILAKQGPQTFPPRADGTSLTGVLVPASEHLEVKAMNCISNALLAAFCHWDGGQLATDEVLDYVTDSPRGEKGLGSNPGCGTQIGTENPPKTDASTRGGRCADLARINATYDAGGALPVPNSPLNINNYQYPFYAPTVFHDKAWEIAAPGRGSLAAGGEQVDTVRIEPGDEPWMDLAGNLNEVVLTMNGATFTGKFGLKFRGIGYSSARSELNFRTDWEGEEGIRRIERPEARAGFAGGRCMRFK